MQQNRVLFDGIKTYPVINKHTIYLHSANLVQDLSPKRKSKREFHFDVAMVWFAICRIVIGWQSIHYPMQAGLHPPGIKAVIDSLRKGTHRPTKIDTRNTKKQLRCRKCSKLTIFKCNKCGSRKHPVPLCGEKMGKNCWKLTIKKATRAQCLVDQPTIMMEQFKRLFKVTLILFV